MKDEIRQSDRPKLMTKGAVFLSLQWNILILAYIFIQKLVHYITSKYSLQTSIWNLIEYAGE
jgi:hypothetical protein